MVFFIVKKDFSITQDFNQTNLNFQAPQTTITKENIYLSSLIEINSISAQDENILSIVDENKISHLITSKELGASYKNQFSQIISNDDKMFNSSFDSLEEQIKNHNNESISIALIGCFGGGIGDLLSSIPALRIFVKKLKNKFKNIHIDLYTHFMLSEIYNIAKFFFEKETYIKNILPLPINIEKLNKYDFYVDTIFFMQDKQSLSLPIVDFSLYKLGLNHTNINNKDKLYNISLKQDIYPLVKKFIKQKAKSKTTILFHPKSSSIVRSIPYEISCLLLNTLLEDEDIFVFSVNNFEDFTHERFLDASRLSLSYEHFFSFIGSVDFCISPDTSVYHIASNLNIPSIVFFTSIEPSLRTKYYKNVYPIFLENKDITNIHNESSANKKINLDNIFNNFDLMKFIQTKNQLLDDIKKDPKHKR